MTPTRLDVFGLSPDEWQAAEAIAVIVGVSLAFFGLVGLGVAVYQLREERRSRHLQALLAVLQEFTSTASPETRQWFETLEPDSLTKLEYRDRARALSIVYAFTRVGLLVEQGFISGKPIFMIIGQTGVNYWERLQPLIQQRRAQEGHSRHAIYYQRFVEHVKEWMKSSEYQKEVAEAARINQDNKS